MRTDIIFKEVRYGETLFRINDGKSKQIPEVENVVKYMSKMYKVVAKTYEYEWDIIDQEWIVEVGVRLNSREYDG